MSVASVLSSRSGLWHALLCDDFGYEPAAPAWPLRSANELAIAVARPEYAPVDSVRFEVRELWLPGGDPDGLGLEEQGCFLSVASWHAQIRADLGEEGAERLDVDRRKPLGLIVHRHPFGFANDVRVPAAPLLHPDAWVTAVEEVIAEAYGY